MAHKFRELIVWQRAMELATQIYTLSREFPREEQFGLTSQLRRAAVSIALNIAEGAGSDSSNDVARFLSIGLRSTYETMAALEIAERLHYCDQARTGALLDELDSIAAMLTGLMKRLRDRSSARVVRELDDVYLADANLEAVLSDYRLLTTDYSLVLREATDADIATIFAVTQAAFGEYLGRLDPPSGVHKETVETVREKLASGHSVLALLGERVVGSVFYKAEPAYVYLGRLAVLPDQRGRGIATALIGYVERRARELARPRVRLGVRVALPHLRARYERMGYGVVEQRYHEGYAEPTYVMMEKLL
ncbi:MAG: four helix bundle protein [Kouleothrix sp.]|nr:four helix bundle protein [Kouleothrix sp.]